VSIARYTVPIPPEAIGMSSSNCRNRIGIIKSQPHFVQGVVDRGAKSPGMKTFVAQTRHVTIFNGLLGETVIVSVIPGAS
jgi:hypothetical protein